MGSGGALRGRSDLSGEMLQAIASRLKDSDDKDVRRAAVEVLKGVGLASLPDMLQAIASRLEHG